MENNKKDINYVLASIIGLLLAVCFCSIGHNVYLHNRIINMENYSYDINVELDSDTTCTCQDSCNNIIEMPSNKTLSNSLISPDLEYISSSAWSKLTTEKRLKRINVFQSILEPIIHIESTATGIPLDVYRYKAAQESRWGSSQGCVEDKNLYGIHWYDGCDYPFVERLDNGDWAKFIVYPSYEESVKHFSNFIQSKLYTQNLPKNPSAKDWSNALCTGDGKGKRYSERCDTLVDMSLVRLYHNYLNAKTNG